MQQALSRCVLVVWGGGCGCAESPRGRGAAPAWGAARGRRPWLERHLSSVSL